MERLTAQQASDLALVTSEGERLGVFGRHGIDGQPFAAVQREARVDLLGVGDLRNEKENPRHRPPATGHRLAIAAGHDCADRLIRTCREPEKADEGNRV